MVSEALGQLFVHADACKDAVPNLLRKVQTHESKMRTGWKKRAQLVGNCIGDNSCCFMP